MPVKHDIDIEARLLITTCEGVAIDTDFIEAIKHYQKTIKKNPAYLGFNEVVDLTNITQLKITLKGIKTISSIAHINDENNAGAKVAFIVSSKRAYRLVKLYRAYRNLAKKLSKEINVFYDATDAYDWVKPVNN